MAIFPHKGSQSPVEKYRSRLCCKHGKSLQKIQTSFTAVSRDQSVSAKDWGSLHSVAKPATKWAFSIVSRWAEFKTSKSLQQWADWPESGRVYLQKSTLAEYLAVDKIDYSTDYSYCRCQQSSAVFVWLLQRLEAIITKEAESDANCGGSPQIPVSSSNMGHLRRFSCNHFITVRFDASYDTIRTHTKSIQCYKMCTWYKL